MRTAMIFATDQRQYEGWASSGNAPARGLSGASLERYMSQLVASNPDLVTVLP